MIKLHVTYSYLWEYYLQTDAIEISIINKQGPISARCGYARKHNLYGCVHQHYRTQLWGVIAKDHIKPVYAPILKCVSHPSPNILCIYGYSDESDKFIPGNGDEIDPWFEIFTMIPWKTKQDSFRGNYRFNLKQRYHFSNIALEQFFNNFMTLS